MKKWIIPLTMIVLAVGAYSWAAERKAYRDIDTDALLAETQVTPKGVEDDHFALIWWIPIELVMHFSLVDDDLTVGAGLSQEQLLS